MKIWSMILFILLLYGALIIPYKIALIDDTNFSFFVIDNAIDLMFLFDIIVNFNTPIVDKTGAITYNRAYITCSYLKSWFLIDLFSGVPVNLILYLGSKNLNTELCRTLRITRLFKIVKLYKKSIFRDKF